MIFALSMKLKAHYITRALDLCLKGCGCKWPYEIQIFFLSSPLISFCLLIIASLPKNEICSDWLRTESCMLMSELTVHIY